MTDYIKKRLHIYLTLIILIAMIISSAAIYRARTVQYSDWRPISGYVVQVRDARHFQVRITYAYMVKGVEYGGSELFHDDPDYELPPAGSSVTVWYDPDNPERSSFYKPEPLLDPYAPFFIGIPLCVGVYLAGTRRRIP